jgi:hypothetical protein
MFGVVQSRVQHEQLGRRSAPAGREQGCKIQRIGPTKDEDSIDPGILKKRKTDVGTRTQRCRVATENLGAHRRETESGVKSVTSVTLN